MIGRTALAGLMVCLVLSGGRSHASPAQSDAYSAATLYNQGNAFARAGNPGMAILNYERARLLAPHDADIAANVRLVRAAAHLPAESDSWFERAGFMANPTLLAWTGVLGVLLAGTTLLWGRFTARHRWPRRATAVVGAALAAWTAGNALVLWPVLHEAVVLVAATPVRVTPVPMGDPLFVLPEAETVRITAEHEDFVLVRTGTGRTGWVARANLAPVVPRQ
jgi:hypothetical protein